MVSYRKLCDTANGAVKVMSSRYLSALGVVAIALGVAVPVSATESGLGLSFDVQDEDPGANVPGSDGTNGQTNGREFAFTAAPSSQVAAHPLPIPNHAPAPPVGRSRKRGVLKDTPPPPGHTHEPPVETAQQPEPTPQPSLMFAPAGEGAIARSDAPAPVAPILTRPPDPPPRSLFAQNTIRTSPRPTQPASGDRSMATFLSDRFQLNPPSSAPSLASAPVPSPPADQPDTPASTRPLRYRAELNPIFQGGSNSLVAKAVGSAEGTRTPDGRKTQHYRGHVDPGNGVWNLGTFSYQHGAGSPSEADAKQLRRLRRQAEIILRGAQRRNMAMSLAEVLNAIDLANQSPRAALNRGGYMDRLKQARDMGMRGSEAILWARTRSYLDPDTNRWRAPGLGNTVHSITRDQRRRMRAIARAIEVNAAPHMVFAPSTSGGGGGYPSSFGSEAAETNRQQNARDILSLDL